MFAIIISLLAVPAIAHARFWYDGGYAVAGTGDCSVTKESPAERCENFETPAERREHFSGCADGAEIVDKGDFVQVTVSWNVIPNSYTYFKSKAVCERFKRAKEREDERDEEREKERLDQYR